MSWLKLFLTLMPLVLELIRLFQRHRLSAKATQEVLDDLKASAQTLVLKAELARANVDQSDEAISADPHNRDNA